MLKNRIILNYVTCFKIGFLPLFPGTFGSAIAFLAFPLVLLLDNFYIWLAVFLLLFLFGIFASSSYSSSINKVDPKEVVIDEFASQLLLIILINYNFLINNTLFVYLLSFIIFRFFDIFKPWPICSIDNKIKSGFGIMLDDFVAAIFTFLILIFLTLIKLI